MLDDAMRSSILDKARPDQIKIAAMRQGMVTLRQNGWREVLNGTTTVDEILNVTARDENSGRLQTVPAEQSSRSIILSDAKDWASTNDCEARIFERCRRPIKILCRLARQDPKNPETLIAEGICQETVSEDFSAGGLRFVSHEFLPVGSLLDVTICLEPGRTPIQCLAKVCRVEDNNLSNVFSVVAYYMDLSSVDRILIEKFIKEQSFSQPVSLPIAPDVQA
jgi:hypothetical protein